jgi:NADPH2 dehydrogenase
VPAVLSPGTQPFFEDADVTRNIPNKFTVMSEADIDNFVEYYRQAALNAMEAGFDGIEIHGANGYVGNRMLKS